MDINFTPKQQELEQALTAAFQNDMIDGDWDEQDYSESGVHSFDTREILENSKFEALSNEEKSEVIILLKINIKNVAPCGIKYYL
jgi:hypothetical protein